MGISAALGSSALLPAGLGFRNKIINGDFRIWQRGTSITTSGAYTADRWAQVSGNSIVHTQSTDTPNGSFTNSISLAGSGSNIVQRVESLNCTGINGVLTVSFWYKSTVGSDPLSMALYYCNTTDSFGSLTQINSNVTVSSSPASTWTYYTYTFYGVPTNARNGLALYIFRGASATSTTLFTGIQLETNNYATPFEHRPIGVELALCQRYFYVLPTGSWSVYNPYWNVGLSGGGVRSFHTHPTTMRSAPTLRTSSGGVLLLFTFLNYNAGAASNLYLEGVAGGSTPTGITYLLYSATNNSGTNLAAGYTQADSAVDVWVSSEL
jgi:hypothetical protein